MVFTSAEILESVKRNQTLVSTTFRFEDSDIYAIADECIRDIIIPTILNLNSDRLIYSQYITLTAATYSYALPYRSIGDGVASIFWQDTADDSPSIKVELTPYDAVDGEAITDTGTNNFFGYFFKNNGEIVTLPRIPASGSSLGYLKVNYFMNHSTLVADTAVATISSVNYGTGVVTMSSTLPTTFTSILEYDFILANRKSIPRLLEIDKVPTAAGASTLTFTVADIPVGLVAGDKVALAGETDTLLLPKDCYKFICKHVESTIQEAQGDLEKLNQTRNSLISLRRLMEMKLTPRNKAQPTPMVNDRPLLRNRRIGNFRLPNTHTP